MRTKPAWNVGDIKLSKATTQYIGTTAKTQHARTTDHQKALKSGNVQNPLVKHWKSAHPNREPAFEVSNVGKTEMYNLNRQIYEGLVIEHAAGAGGSIMNSKSEWGKSKLFRVEISNSQGGWY